VPQKRAILSYFNSQQNAAAALTRLRSEGIEDIRLDRVSLYQPEPTWYRTGLISGLLDPLEYVGTMNVLEASQVTDSGQASPSVLSPAYLLTVVADEEQLPHVQAILENYGGSL